MDHFWKENSNPATLQSSSSYYPVWNWTCIIKLVEANLGRWRLVLAVNNLKVQEWVFSGSTLSYDSAEHRTWKYQTKAISILNFHNQWPSGSGAGFPISGFIEFFFLVLYVSHSLTTYFSSNFATFFKFMKWLHYGNYVNQVILIGATL